MANAAGRKKSTPVRRETKETQIYTDLTSLKIPTAAYCRLSVKDEEEESIENQIRIVKDHIISSPELYLAETYVDNGISGTDFKRPAWIRLMSDVRDGRINCIVVKDLSRFGRDYIEAGFYINNIFPKLGVRFIAISEGFDNTRADDRSEVMVAIKNIVNYAYAKDISQKISRTMFLKKARGDVMGVVPFGYKKTSDGVLPDPKTAPAVKMMFVWSMLGVDNSDIAERMNLLEIAGKNNWTAAAVGRMLSNVFYKGDLISGKKVTRMKRVVNKDPSEWFVFKNHHEAIISEDIFDRVQTAVKRRKRNESRDGEGRRSFLRGILYCGLCGRRLVYQKVNSSNPTAGYYCYAHTGKNAIRSGIALSRRPFIGEEELFSVLAEGCGRYMNYLKKIRYDLEQFAAAGGAFDQLEDHIVKLKDRRRHDEEFCEHIYEDYSQGILDADTFISIRNAYFEKLKKNSEELQSADVRLKKIRSAYAEVTEFINRMCEKKQSVLTEKLTRQLAERIELDADGRISIRFRHQDTIKALFVLSGGDHI